MARGLGGPPSRRLLGRQQEGAGGLARHHHHTMPFVGDQGVVAHGPRGEGLAGRANLAGDAVLGHHHGRPAGRPRALAIPLPGRAHVLPRDLHLRDLPLEVALAEVAEDARNDRVLPGELAGAVQVPRAPLGVLGRLPLLLGKREGHVVGGAHALVHDDGPCGLYRRHRAHGPLQPWGRRRGPGGGGQPEDRGKGLEVDEELLRVRAAHQRADHLLGRGDGGAVGGGGIGLPPQGAQGQRGPVDEVVLEQLRRLVGTERGPEHFDRARPRRKRLVAPDIHQPGHHPGGHELGAHCRVQREAADRLAGRPGHRARLTARPRTEVRR
mmetsp:Transcript_63898/g.202183  ORF Transcript_63898/g.202183 Transcript_63898/m.202183 type:complete len:325 (-) Transcript_63898:1207-2181(-)